MADQRTISMHAGHATPKNIVLRALPVAAIVAGTTIWLYAGHATPSNIILGDPTVIRDAGGPAFPTQYLGLRAFFQSAVKDLCLVALADAPTGMGGRLTVDKGGTLYAVYLVETSDPDASPVRVRTSTAVKAIRNYTV